MLFSKAASKKIAVMSLLTNCGENPYKTPVKKASLGKWLSVRLRTKWLWVRIPLL